MGLTLVSWLYEAGSETCLGVREKWEKHAWARQMEVRQLSYNG